MFALTLIKTQDPHLSAVHVALVQSELERMNVSVSPRPPEWREDKHSVRGWLMDKPTPEQMAHLRGVMAEHAIDVICEAESMPKLRLACFDLESTCIEQESLDLLGDRVGHRHAIERITARAMNGEITMHEAFVERVAMLKGVGPDDIRAVIHELTGFDHMHDTITWLQGQGVRCVLVSSGVDIFVEPMAKRYGFDDYFCSHIDLDGGHITGTLSGHIMTKEDKASTTARLMTEMGILNPQQALAMGDGGNDLLMMGEVGRPFAWRPKPILSAAVENQFLFSDWRALRTALA